MSCRTSNLLSSSVSQRRSGHALLRWVPSVLNSTFLYFPVWVAGDIYQELSAAASFWAWNELSISIAPSFWQTCCRKQHNLVWIYISRAYEAAEHRKPQFGIIHSEEPCPYWSFGQRELKLGNCPEKLYTETQRHWNSCKVSSKELWVGI